MTMAADPMIGEENQMQVQCNEAGTREVSGYHKQHVVKADSSEIPLP